MIEFGPTPDPYDQVIYKTLQIFWRYTLYQLLVYVLRVEIKQYTKVILKSIFSI